MDKVVEIQNLHKVYRDGFDVHALRGVDLDIARGDFMTIAGPSGSGKTTLLNILGGLDRPTEGRVFIEGQEVTAMSRSELADLRRRRLGFVFQSFNLIPVLTARENVEFALILRGVEPNRRRELPQKVLGQVGLDECMRERRPFDLSGGQQQRVAVARAIVGEPAVVLADEPTANLDTENALALLDLMERLNEERQATFIFSTHDPRVMERAKRHVMLRDGEVVSDERRA
ncbi:MAG: ATP-binding cassette domain-containing protein [candidate division Zixibacteria bacterium]|nr:ATP-binding cassette domain-containing protein [candidate division Zixibacteria bacterium]